MDKSKLNPHFETFDVDYLYHLGLDTSMDLSHVFGDVKYVIFTLSNAEASVMANEFARTLYKIHEENFSYRPIYKTERFHMYKVGVSIIISIGVGMPSLLICINEITKLLVHLKKYDVTFFKVGSCGGLGVNDGDIIVSHTILNAKLESYFDSIECGEIYRYPTIFNDSIARQIVEFSHAVGNQNTIIGTNLSTHDFYEEQARLNGAVPSEFSLSDANNYLQNAYQNGVRSIDMESLAFAGFCNMLSIPGCVIGISVVNRLLTEHVSMTMDRQLKILAKLSKILIRYIQTNTNC